MVFSIFLNHNAIHTDAKSEKDSKNNAVRVSLADLIQLYPAANLDLHQNKIRALQGGNYLSKFRGRGMEFNEVRPYLPGDDLRNLDWRVTARTGKPHTKLFREERERPIFLGIDFRSSMFFATRGMFKSVMTARLAALLAWSANHHGDRVGGQVFTDHSYHECKPQRGKQAVLHLFKILAGLSDNMQLLQNENRQLNAEHFHLSNHQSNPLTKSLARLCRHARPGSVVFLLSDFRHLDQAGESHLMRLARHCDVFLLHISDPFEHDWPAKGRYRLSNGKRDFMLDTTDKRSVDRYHDRFTQKMENLKALAFKFGMRLVTCSTTDDPIHVLRYGIKPQ